MNPNKKIQTILQAANDQPKQAISAHISILAEKLIAKEKDIHLNAHWNNESSEVIDKVKMLKIGCIKVAFIKQIILFYC